MDNNMKFIIVFVILCIFAAIGFYFAAKSTTSHRKAYKQQEAQLKELKRLKEKYEGFTAETLEECPEEEILAGVNVLYQRQIMKAEDPEKTFLSFSEEIQKLYVLQVFVEDGGVKEFYSKSDELLTSRLLSALEMIGVKDFALSLGEVAKMYDKNDETVSYDIGKIERLDKVISEENILTEIKLYAAKYIKANCDSLKVY